MFPVERNLEGVHLAMGTGLGADSAVDTEETFESAQQNLLSRFKFKFYCRDVTRSYT